MYSQGFMVLVFSIIFPEICSASDIFHQKSKITFYPDSPSSYFGYAVVVSNSRLLVGAPKATSRVKEATSPGLVFSCELSLDSANVTCFPMGMDDSDHDKSIRRIITVKDFFRDDMWFGATIAAFPEGKLLVCAPRWADPYKEKHLLANGACYVETKRRGMTLTPLKDQSRLAYRTDGARKEYGDYGTHLNYYAYGQAGISLKVTERDSIIIGAPGLLQWTGGIIDYMYSPDANSVIFAKQPITNPYYTKELGPDDYFGYSVESGIFEQNGSTLYVAGAPRAKMGYGQVLIFEPAVRELDPLNIRAKVKGPQLGSYFGASLCCTDLNGDGRSDLLVGAPNFVRKDGEMPYDQGAVFVFMAGSQDTLVMAEAGHVSGIGESGARFGSAIAALGDVDGDGYNDIAIGAPWENDGIGAVYIYKGSPEGLKVQYAQRIIAEDAKGFGMSISKGMDIDGNNCNDLSIGAHESGTAYLYRCIPTIKVHVAIKVPDAMNLPKNASNFSAIFCVSVPPMKSWSHVKIDLKAKITIDPESNRALTAGGSEYKVTAQPGKDICDEQVVEVKPTADLSKPILMIFNVEPMEPLTDDSLTFHKNAARLSEDSTLHTSFLLQLIRDCGEDLICTPLLIMGLEALNSLYTPGTNDTLGVKVTVLNKEEPAYGAKIYLTLPLSPVRVPGDCTLEGLNMTCDLPAPLERGESIDIIVELDYTLKTDRDTLLKVEAKLKDSVGTVNLEVIQDVYIVILPMTNFSITGKVILNDTMAVNREKYYTGDNVTFAHYFEITNFGPSDCYSLKAIIKFPENVTLSTPIEGCNSSESKITCDWAIAAKTSKHITLYYRYDLKKYGKFLEERNVFNATSLIFLLGKDLQQLTLTTKLVLDPRTPMWALIVGSVAGLTLLAMIVYALHKYGFFSRTRPEGVKNEDSSSNEDPCTSPCTSPPSVAEESTQELIDDDSE